MNLLKFLFVAAGAAILGFGLFALLAYRSATTTPMGWDHAVPIFQAALDAHRERPAVCGFDEFGKLVRTATPPILPVPSPERLRVLAFAADRKLLVQADIPYWLFRMQGPLMDIALRDVDYDLARLGLDPGQLAEFGAGPVIDEPRRNGDRILIWLE